MSQQSLMLVRRSGLARFISKLLRAPWGAGEKPEEIMRLRLEPFDRLKIPLVARARSTSRVRTSNVQPSDDEELDRFVELVGAGMLA
jgi:hypothetical protein